MRIVDKILCVLLTRVCAYCGQGCIRIVDKGLFVLLTMLGGDGYGITSGGAIRGNYGCGGLY